MIDKEKILNYLDNEIVFLWEMNHSNSDHELCGMLRECGRIKEKIKKGEFDYREEVKQ